MNKNKRIRSLLINLALLTLFFILLNLIMPAPKDTDITYNEFLKMVEDGQVKSVEINDTELKITSIDEKTVYHTGAVQNDDLVKTLYDAGVEFSQGDEQDISAGEIFLSLLLNFGPFIIIIIIFAKIFSGIAGQNGGIFSVGKSKASLNMDKDTGVTFADVAGQEEAKEQLTEIIDFLHNPQKYQDIGAKIPTGALLVGPPGTGKTLLAKAVAGEAGVPFYFVSGSDFIEMYVGVGASRVRDLFEQAKKNAPCIIFIDEVDAIAKTRDDGRAGGNDERDQTLNQLLSEIDGFDSSTGVIILAATNRPEILDKAFLRAGRFDRKVIVERPDFKGRVDTLKVHSRNVKLDGDVDFKAIAYATAGSVGADLENIVNEAALRAVKMGRKAVTQADFMEAIEVVFAGKEKKDRIMSDEEKRLVAYHEVGHAVVSAMQKSASPVQKITIIPRTKGSLGYTLQVPEEEKFLSDKDEMLEEVTTLLGGRCAEEVIFNKVTTGASNDIERATDIAREMVTIYGMSDAFDMVALESIQNKYLDGTLVRNCSEATSTKVDAEIQKIIKECHEKARDIIESNRDLMDAVADYLLEKESITGEEFRNIFERYHPEIKLKVTTIDDLEKPSTRKLPLKKADEAPAIKKSRKEIREEARAEAEPLPPTNTVVTTTPDTDDEEVIRIPINAVKNAEKDSYELDTEVVEVSEYEKAEEAKTEIRELKMPQEDTSEPEKDFGVNDPVNIPPVEEVKPRDGTLQKPIKIDRPSASVLGPKKQKKKKPQNKATASDMQNLLNKVEKQKANLYEEAQEVKPDTPADDAKDVKVEVGKPAQSKKQQETPSSDEDDFTEDMY